MVNVNVLQHHTSRAVVELSPASISLRHKASTGAEPRATKPTPEQQSEPINSARIETPCEDCEDGLAIELVRSAIETLLRAPKAAPTVGGAAFWAGIDHFGFCRAVSLRSIVRFESHSRACSAGKILPLPAADQSCARNNGRVGPIPALSGIHR